MDRRNLLKLGALIPFFPSFKSKNPYLENVVKYNVNHNVLLDEKLMGRVESIIGMQQKDVNAFRMQIGIALNDIAYGNPNEQSLDLLSKVDKAINRSKEKDVWDYQIPPWYEVHQGLVVLARGPETWQRLFAFRSIAGIAREANLSVLDVQQIVEKYYPRIVRAKIIQNEPHNQYCYWEHIENHPFAVDYRKWQWPCNT